jgi:hydroxypyruvate isomerase
MNRRVFAQLMTGALASPVWLRAAEPEAKGVRLSFMLWALAKQASFDRSLEIVAEAGYQGVELTGQFQKWSPDEWRRVRTRLRSLGLVVDSASGVRVGFAVPAETEAFHTQLAALLQSAKKLECPQVIALSGKRIVGMDAAVQRKTAIENLKRAAEAAAKEQIEIVIEPIDLLENPTIYLTTVSDAFEIARAVNAPQVKVLYDFYHEQRGFGNLIEKLEKNIDLVGLVHVADVPGRHEPGTGEIDYTTIYRKLAELKYSRWIAMEYYPTEEPVASLKKSKETVQQAFAMESR